MNDEFELEDLLQESSYRARTTFRNRQTEQAEARAAQQQTVAQDLGWDSSTGARLCQTDDGSIVLADSISPQAGTGLVSLSKPAQGRSTIKSPL